MTVTPAEQGSNQGQPQQNAPGTVTPQNQPQQTQQQQSAPQQIQQRAPYADYLEKVPEGLRPVVEPAFKEWDGNVNQRFQQYNDQLKEYERYQQVIDQYEPEAIGQAIQLAEQLNTQEGAEELFQQLAQALGYQVEGTPGQPGTGNVNQNQNQNLGDDDDYSDLFNNPRFQQLEQAITNISQQFQQTQETMTQQQQLQQVEQEWNATLEKNKSLVTNADGSENKDAIDAILAFAQVDGNIEKAFEKYSRVVGKQATAMNAPGQNAPIIGGGSQNNMPSNVVEPAKMTPQQRKEAAIAALQEANRQK
jgi:hypothetical protein